MARESVEKIWKTEEEARNKIEAAQLEADKISKEAAEKAIKIANEEKEAASQQAKILMSQAEEEAQREIERLEAQNIEACKQIQVMAEKNKDSVISFIIRRIIG